MNSPHLRVSAFLCISLLHMTYAQDSTLITFAMEDQFGNTYTHESWGEKVFIVVGSDRGGSAFNALWAGTLHDSLRALPGFHTVQFVGVSDLRGVPFFLRGYVRGKLPTDPEQWVLMDWNGEFAKAYQFVESHCNILIFDSRGRLVHHAAVREFETETFSSLMSVVKGLGSPDAEISSKQDPASGGPEHPPRR